MAEHDEAFWKARAEENERKEMRALGEWRALWQNRCDADPRIERVASALCVAKGRHPLEIRKCLDSRWIDIVNPPSVVFWLVDEPFWKEYRQEAWEFLHMLDAAAR